MVPGALRACRDLAGGGRVTVKEDRVALEETDPQIHGCPSRKSVFQPTFPPTPFPFLFLSISY